MSDTDLFGDYVSDTIRDRNRLRDRMNEVSSELAHMIGYHDRDGAVPVDKLRALLDRLNPYAVEAGSAAVADSGASGTSAVTP